MTTRDSEPAGVGDAPSLDFAVAPPVLGGGLLSRRQASASELLRMAERVPPSPPPERQNATGHGPVVSRRCYPPRGFHDRAARPPAGGPLPPAVDRRPASPAARVREPEPPDGEHRVGGVRHGLHPRHLRPAGDGPPLDRGHGAEAGRARVPLVGHQRAVRPALPDPRPLDRQEARPRREDGPLQIRGQGLPRVPRAPPRPGAEALPRDQAPRAHLALPLRRHALRALRGGDLRGAHRRLRRPRRAGRPGQAVHRHPRGHRRGPPRRLGADRDRDPPRPLPRARRHARRHAPQAALRRQEDVPADQLARPYTDDADATTCSAAPRPSTRRGGTTST